ncbi:cytidylate kinase family protein [uncultured Succinatimonas sp.]|uniref:cytidylate kinase family protein n=1 Tax=uncultured Succinatimonas sp. TaxID=1262973 RepID=UPI0025CBA239|nr:cytidylate kinase family protein [uncultured Succinatimonas sp.]
MTKAELAKRYFIFFLSLWINGFGVALVTIAALGTTPISSAWYEISLHTPLTFGMVTMLGNLILITSQYFMLKDKKDKKALWGLFSQIPATLLFSVSIDVNMFILQNSIAELHFYLYRFALLLLGSIILAFGVALEVKADVALVAGEAFVKAVCVFLHKEFGIIKTCFDLSLVCLAVIIGLVCTNFTEVASVREGTLVGALMVGPCVRIIAPHLGFIDRFFGSVTTAAKEQADFAFNPVITISREYGCGGRILGKMLAKKLNLKFYDSEIITLIAKETGYSEEYVSRNENRLDNALLFQMIMQDYAVPLDKSLSKQDALYVASAKVIRKLASDGPCVIVGRGADDILKDNPLCVKIRLFASFDSKLERCLNTYHLTKEKALKAMNLFDKRRAEHYAHYANADINDIHRYDLVLDSGAIGLDECCNLICDLFKYKANNAAQKA